MIEGTLIKILQADPGVAAITTRVRPFQDVTTTPRPCLTYHRISTQRPFHNDGPVGLATAHYQLDVWADTQLQALRLADATRKALDGKRGTFFGQRIDQVRVDDQGDGVVQVRPGAEKPVARVTLDLVMSFGE